MRTVNWRASVSCHFASTPARSLNAPLRIPLATSDLVYASVWLLIFRVYFLATWRPVANPRREPPGPAVFSPSSLFFIRTTALSSSSSRIPQPSRTVLLASAPSPLFVRRLLLELCRPANSRRVSAGPRRAEIFAAPSRPQHSRFFASFSASPSTVLVGDVGPLLHRRTSSPATAPLEGKEIPKPKPPVQCGSCIVGSRQGSTFFKFTGLESCRAWQGTFFYVKNNGRANLIDLPPFQVGPPSRANWSYNPKTDHAETNRVVRFMASLKKETNICSDDIIRTFISRRVLPLKRRVHRMSEMYGPGDPTKITGRPLSKKDVVRKAKQICQTAMPFEWEWGLLPLSTTNPPTQEAKDRFPLIQAERRGICVKRALDSFDPDPYIRWKDLKMGKTPAARLGRSPPKPTGSSDDLSMLEIHEHAPPLRAEAGSEFVDKLMAQGQKNKMPASDAGSSQAPPSKRFRTEPLGEKEVGVRRYGRKQMPTASGLAQGQRALKVPQGPQPLLLAQARHHLVPATPLPPFGGTTSSGRAAPSSSDHRTEEDLSFLPENQDTGASNIGAEEEAAGRAEPSAPPVLEKKTTSAPGSSAPESSNLGDAPSAPPSPRTILMPPPDAPRIKPSGAAPTAPPPKISKLIKGKATASNAPSGGQQPLVLHVSKAASAASKKATGLLGRITEFQRRGQDLGHLLPYAQKWNAADMTPATRGLGKDRLPAPDPVGDRSSEEHFMRLRSAVKELDSAWYDATNNLMLTADARKALFEELLWEHRDLAEAHDKCQVIPEASIEALKEQLAAAQREKEQLIRQHQEELGAQKTSYQELKAQLIQLGLDHAKALKAAEADAAAKMHEALEDAGNSNMVLQAELEELPSYPALQDSVAWRGGAGYFLTDQRPLKGAGKRIREWQCSAARAGADSALRVACSWYPELNLDALTGVREGAETDLDPILTAKRQDRAYHIAEYADMRTFIPPPPDVQDYLDEEEDEAEEEPLGDAGAGDAPPEAPAA
ncbi:hypothetical protein QYE76_071328 [Lolium multiflorum]|uniref:Uncharacterized protein n=1 Tax=Lolium multiflorum TaxID=4521 RepID=A0AAD8WET2_LOLMU|nr:hypothetical protein QYE76_071328 [Lolium multiflorum]